MTATILPFDRNRRRSTHNGPTCSDCFLYDCTRCRSDWCRCPHSPERGRR
jgi:hypothetical protein